MGKGSMVNLVVNAGPPGGHTGRGERLWLSLQAGPPNQTNTDCLYLRGATDAARPPFPRPRTPRRTASRLPSPLCKP